MKYDELINRLYYDVDLAAILPQYVSIKYKKMLSKENVEINYVDLMILAMYAEGLDNQTAKHYANDLYIGVVYEETINKLTSLELLKDGRITQLGKHITDFAYYSMNEISNAIHDGYTTKILYNKTKTI